MAADEKRDSLKPEEFARLREEVRQAIEAGHLLIEQAELLLRHAHAMKAPKDEHPAP